MTGRQLWGGNESTDDKFIFMSFLNKSAISDIRGAEPNLVNKITGRKEGKPRQKTTVNAYKSLLFDI